MPYCPKCYADLDGADGECPKCGRAFDPADPKTTLARPFPGKWTVVAEVVVTTLFAAGVALVVAIHQANRSSGH